MPAGVTMALITCRECGTLVSSEAPSCPRCGAPEPGRMPERVPVPAPVRETPVSGEPSGWRPIAHPLLGGTVVVAIIVAAANLTSRPSSRSGPVAPASPSVSSPTSASTRTVEPSLEPANFEPAKPLKWAQLGVNGVRLGMTPAQVRKAKGQPQGIVQFAPGPSWNYPDVLVEFTKGVVTDVACDARPCVTADLVRSGATRTEVAAVYGAGDNFQDYAWIYDSERQDCGLTISFQEGRMWTARAWCE
jgi:hypothetical protein